MELKSIESSRVIYLTQARRRKGQIFLPRALEALLGRYRFQKFPTPEQMLSDTLLFQHGEFEDVGINEFGIYQDGLVASTRSDTDFLDRFIADLLGWAAKELDIVEIDVPPRERHYESALIVSMNVDLDNFPYLTNLGKALTEKQAGYGLRPFEFSFSAFQVGADPTQYAGKQPLAFTLARRVNVPFGDGIFYATAPLRTQDHLAALEALERDLN